MNCRIIINKFSALPFPSGMPVGISKPANFSRLISTSTATKAMKPGTPIAGLDFMKNSDPVVSKERSEYPEWMNNLTKADATLGKLRRLDLWKAEEEEQKRFFKLDRRSKIKSDNIDAGLR